MKLVLFAFPLLLGFSAAAQNCTLTKANDELTRAEYLRTQEEVLYSTAGRRWAYYLTSQNDQTTLNLKYTQTDMVFSVPKSARLELTTADGGVISLLVMEEAPGVLRHNKGVKSWAVNIPFVLNPDQIAKLKASPLKAMKLEFEKGQATMEVPKTKTMTVAQLTDCITKK